jgi:hypothetical protein
MNVKVQDKAFVFYLGISFYEFQIFILLRGDHEAYPSTPREWR